MAKVRSGYRRNSTKFNKIRGMQSNFVRIRSDPRVEIRSQGIRQLSNRIQPGLFDSNEIGLGTNDLKCCIFYKPLYTCKENKAFESL
jgi:hypothetical protein